jgi:hypothetical protein
LWHHTWFTCPLGSLSPTDGETAEQWCHNFVKSGRNEVSSPHARLRRVPVSCPARCKRNHEWCHNFAKHGKNEVLAPRRHPPSLAPCLADPAAGDREWCHNFAKFGRNEVMAPEGPGNPAYRPPGDGCPRGCKGERIRGPTKCAAGPEPMPLGCVPMFKNERFMTRSEPSWIACRIAGRSRS